MTEDGARKLEIGSGNRPKLGYEHLDVDPNCPDLDFCCSMDAIPVDDDVFSEIVSVHSIEHIGWRKGRDCLKEWYRVMKPGGRLYIATPNLEFICRAYLDNGHEWIKDFNNLQPEEKEHLKIKDFHCHTMWANFKLFSSGAGGDEHMACYDKFMLTRLLEEVGFRHIKVLNDTDCLEVQCIK